MGLLDVIADIIKAKQATKDSSVIVKNYISGNNTQNNKIDNKTTNNAQKNYKNNNTSTNKPISSTAMVSLKTIKLYCTGAKGKVYTTTFYKNLNKDFGIEVVIKNNTPKIQPVKLGHCIYDKSGKNTISAKTFSLKVNPHSTFKKDILVDVKTFKTMKPGKYKSQLWLNDKRIQRVFFTVLDK